MARLPATPYAPFLEDISRLLDEARQQAVRTLNAFLTATYWEIGRRIVEYEQKGRKRAEYGSALLQRLSKDLTARHGRGFGVDNLQRMRSFYLAYEPEIIYATLSRKSMGAEVLSEKYAILSRISEDQVRKKKTVADTRRMNLRVNLALFGQIPELRISKIREGVSGIEINSYFHVPPYQWHGPQILTNEQGLSPTLFINAHFL